MSYYKDLEKCDYFPFNYDKLLAVGWLSNEHKFPKGVVSSEFFKKLCDLSVDPWAPIISAGGHTCELCQYDPPMFSKNLFIPYKNIIYVAPVAITHYIAQHWYKPPDIFVEAIKNCPEMNSMEFKKYLLENGGRELMKKVKA